MANTNMSFNQALLKENDSEARKQLNKYYSELLEGYEITYIDYNEHEYGKFLQSSGVDMISTKYNEYGSIQKQFFFQEKITFNRYSRLLFEYEKRSGEEGWATSMQEKADFLVYYQAGRIYLIDFAECREYLRKNLAQLKLSGYCRTDNHNVLVSITELEKHVKMEVYESEQVQ